VSCHFGTLAKDAWFMDSGASHHVTGSREVFTNISEEGSKLHVKLGNDVGGVVEGIGTIQFQLESRSPLEVKDVLYVPRLTKNLLAIFRHGGQGV